MKNNFEFVVKKSGTDVWYITCKDSDCSWRLRVKKLVLASMFEITAYNNTHPCSLELQQKDHRQTSPWVVDRLIKNKYAIYGTSYMEKNIKEDMKNKYHIEMSYMKVKNPGTITDFVTKDNRFLYCLFSLGVSIMGFKWCRPVICEDDTVLKIKYGGHMLCAVALDANNQLYPIAFSIVDSENQNSWTYFMRKLKESIRDVNNLDFVSYIHASIIQALEIVFSNAYHGACYHHITMNVAAIFKTDHCHDLMWNAAY
ncbi:uncharacterized protein LOC133790216 [Humulus lupulus]|uniref:uncharacterized protein LOC133790216 n=1 Tax=Humulus lupulus TaxID=3486 RepID=UPI002B411E7B|nr:uncharacterized protein LOC133790216 [Humulus lupulus]